MISDTSVLTDLLEDTISLSVEERTNASLSSFKEYLSDMLPASVLAELETIAGGPSFLEDIWEERFCPKPSIANENSTDSSTYEEDVDLIGERDCLICERSGMHLTRHHVYPRETHQQLLKKWKTTKAHADVNLNETIAICRMCHSTIHRLFTNQELAATYHTIEALLSDDRFVRYAKWASTLPAGRKGCM
jgi:hypothetical protein